MICRSRDVCSVNKVAITNNVGAQYKKSKFSLLCKDHAVGMTDMGSEVIPLKKKSLSVVALESFLQMGNFVYWYYLLHQWHKN